MAIRTAARIQVFPISGGAARLDIGVDDIEWGKCERQLYVQDAFDMIGVSASHSQLYDSHASTRTDTEDELVWGHSYQLVTTRCPI